MCRSCMDDQSPAEERHVSQAGETVGRNVLLRRPGKRCPVSGATWKTPKLVHNASDSIEARLWTNDGLQSLDTTDDVLVPGKITLLP